MTLAEDIAVVYGVLSINYSILLSLANEKYVWDSRLSDSIDEMTGYELVDHISETIIVAAFNHEGRTDIYKSLSIQDDPESRNDSTSVVNIIREKVPDTIDSNNDKEYLENLGRTILKTVVGEDDLIRRSLSTLHLSDKCLSDHEMLLKFVQLDKIQKILFELRMWYIWKVYSIFSSSSPLSEYRLMDEFWKFIDEVDKLYDGDVKNALMWCNYRGDEIYFDEEICGGVKDLQELVVSYVGIVDAEFSKLFEFFENRPV